MILLFCILEQTRLRSRSPDYGRSLRRSFSPSYQNKITESPIGGYKPDSTISDTELERQQFMQSEQYWNSAVMSPKRLNLDDRIHRILSDSPTIINNLNTNMSSCYSTDNMYQPYTIHDNQHSEMYYSDLYYNNPSNVSEFIPPHHLPRYQQTMNNLQHFDDTFNNCSSSRNFVNNSNLVEITQQNRERQQIGSNQVAVQVGNVLEIVPSNKISTPPDEIKTKALSQEEIKQQQEKKEQAKLRRKVDRERKRMAKFVRKEKMRLEIQRYFDAGINIEDSDDEKLIDVREIDIFAIPDRSIMKKSNLEEKSTNVKKVLFSDGFAPGEVSSEHENDDNNDHEVVKEKLKRKKMRKRRLKILKKKKSKALSISDMEILLNYPDTKEINPIPPSPPLGSPPIHLKQPRLKKITTDMFAAFTVNLEPIYYHMHRYQENASNSYQIISRGSKNIERVSRYTKNLQGGPPLYSHHQQQRHCFPAKSHNLCKFNITNKTLCFKN